ncbi:MAG: bifunctional phosphoribosylaminoimidazolecarboxamide formyltransferase/IMP cyclohydrolase, partial [Candidatus Paceibacterota bacterium]
MPNTKTALISVYHKQGIEDFARQLIELGWQIFASGGTAKYLKENSIPIKDVAELVGGDAILDHRVVTLSREVHAGLLSRNITEDIKEMEKLGLPRIDLVCCDFYPLAEEINKSDSSIDSILEKTDIGGPTMVRSGAKGGRIVICDPSDRQIVINQLKDKGDIDEKTLQYLRAKAEAVVSAYCLDSARFHSKGNFDGILGWMVSELAYGENRDQSPAFLYS